MNKYSNVPFLILAFWLLLVLSAFRITMMNIDMKIHDIHLDHVVSDFSAGILSFFGFGDQEQDSSEKIRETLDRSGNLIGSTVYGSPYQQDKSVIDKENYLLLVNHEEKPVKIETPQKEVVQKKTVTEKQEKKTKPKAEDKPKPKEEKIKTVYILQCGTYNNKVQAEEQKGRIASLGYSAYIKDAKSGKSGAVTWYRVLVGPFDSEEQQSSNFDRLKSQQYSCYKISYGGNR